MNREAKHACPPPVDHPWFSKLKEETMRLKLFAIAAAVTSLTAFSASAQESDGQYSADLRRMITETASGNCPTEIMAEQLLAACQQQIAQMSAGLASLGDVQSITFSKADDTPEGRVETYAVVFANGTKLNWGIGHKKDGKYGAAYATS
jgi:hypothetical protein